MRTSPLVKGAAQDLPGRRRTASAMTTPLASLLSAMVVRPALSRDTPSGTHEPPRGSGVPAARWPMRTVVPRAGMGDRAVPGQETSERSPPAPVAGVYYDYDDGDRLTSKITDGVADAGANTYGYDQADQHGDVIAGFDPTLDGGSDSAAYDPFGKVTGTSGAERPIGYQGDYTDPDTGQVNMTARWCDPGSGTFTSRDDVSPRAVRPASPTVMGMVPRRRPTTPIPPATSPTVPTRARRFRAGPHRRGARCPTAAGWLAHKPMIGIYRSCDRRFAGTHVPDTHRACRGAPAWLRDPA